MAVTILFIMTVCIDALLPFALAVGYKGYSHMSMALSVLGARQSPVKWFYNVWCMLSGVCFAACGIAVAIRSTSGLTIAIAVLLSVYGLACETVSGFFPLNEKKEDVDVTTKIHGGFSAIGFMCLLPVPLSVGLCCLDTLAAAIVSFACFALAMLFFCFFVMGDKPKFRNTALSYEGLWQRLIVFLCYISLIAYPLLF